MAFSTQIVKSRKFSIIEKIILGILLLSSNYYLFLINDEYKNTYLTLFFFICYATSMPLTIMPQLLKPKHLGELIISDGKFKILIDGHDKEILFSDIKSLFLKYSGYGSFWRSHTIYGNKNYLIIIDKNNSKTELEVLIKNKAEKEKLKSILNTPELHDIFLYKPILNTKLSF
jgi:hypothetical protein